MKRYFCVLVVALAVLLGPATAQADVITTIFSDTFSAETPDVLDSTLTKWNIVSGSIDVLSAGNVCGPAGNYSTCVDLDGTGKVAGTIRTKQTFSLEEGAYELKFDLAGSNRNWELVKTNTVVVSLGEFFLESFTLDYKDPFQTFTRQIIVNTGGSANIQFAHAGADWMGLLLDNVFLSKVTVVPTPESSGWELIIAAAGLAVWGFRKNVAKLAARA